MKLRIKYLAGIGCFSQVKTSIFPGWETICRRSEGFGLCAKSHVDYPMKTKAEALGLCYEYRSWVEMSRGRPIYERV